MGTRADLEPVMKRTAALSALYVLTLAVFIGAYSFVPLG
jgi:hypothetical protein